jgi:hypothetical protein
MKKHVKRTKWPVQYQLSEVMLTKGTSDHQKLGKNGRFGKLLLNKLDLNTLT